MTVVHMWTVLKFECWFRFRFGFLCFVWVKYFACFCVSLDHFIPVLLAFVMFGLVSSVPIAKILAVKITYSVSSGASNLLGGGHKPRFQWRIAMPFGTLGGWLGLAQGTIRESQPVCDHCKCHLTVKHMLLGCPSTAVIRHKYFSSTTCTLKELFSNVDARCIIDFTKESGFYQAI